jgi:hypothetical protein
MKAVWFGTGFALGLTALSLSMASVPNRAKGAITDDTALYQSLSEIHLPKQGKPSFDGDIARLSALEERYHERLPVLAQHPELKGPMNRIQQQKYRYSGKPQQAGRVAH